MWNCRTSNEDTENNPTERFFEQTITFAQVGFVIIGERDSLSAKKLILRNFRSFFSLFSFFHLPGGSSF